MPPKRSFPAKRNELLHPDNTPPHEILIERRRLGQTKLEHSTDQVASPSSASKHVFDYVHLRAPLPRDFKGSEMFPASKEHPAPDNYYLTRRSSDGFISASGMFRAAFPWATRDEDRKEREHIRGLASADQEEMAGNIWVTVNGAIDLAKDYDIADWILALVDNERVELQSIETKKPITQPPKVSLAAARKRVKSGSKSKSEPNSPASTTHKRKPSKAGDASPTKGSATSPTRAKASPRKRNTKKAADGTSATQDATAALQNALSETPVIGEPVAVVTRDATLGKDKVRLSVQEDVADEGDVETTRTTVRVEMPADAPDLKLPRDTEGVVDKAREIVREIKDLQADGEGMEVPPASPAKKRGTKRKASISAGAVEEPEEVVEEVVGGSSGGGRKKGDEPAAKRTRVMVAAEEYRREKIKRRAFMGLSGALAVGAMIPFLSNVSGFFFS